MEINLITIPTSVIRAEDVVLCLAVVVVSDTVVLLSFHAELFGERLLPRGVCRAGALKACVALCVRRVRERAETVVFGFVGGVGKVEGCQGGGLVL